MVARNLGPRPRRSEAARPATRRLRGGRIHQRTGRPSGRHPSSCSCSATPSAQPRRPRLRGSSAAGAVMPKRGYGTALAKARDVATQFPRLRARPATAAANYAAAPDNTFEFGLKAILEGLEPNSPPTAHQPSGRRASHPATSKNAAAHPPKGPPASPRASDELDEFCRASRSKEQGDNVGGRGPAPNLRFRCSRRRLKRGQRGLQPSGCWFEVALSGGASRA
jgi:hypothetical protein